MGEPHVVSALREKRAEISGEILRLEKEIAQRRTELTHIDATLKLFLPTLAPHTIRPKQRKNRKSCWCEHGERSRLVLSLLRNSDRALTTREITALLMTNAKLDPSNQQMREVVHKSILGVLNTGARKGIINKSGGSFGEVVRWQVAPLVMQPGENAASSRKNR
jgi:hypothetical protein